ncbi:salt tolerance down-regulator-domain-containing protein, partial [Absidia repens]
MDNTDERQRIREFWLQLGEDERRSLVKVEKEAVLRKMKEQQKHSCNCSVCGKKRTAIEDELEVLYDAYYEELEQYANHQQYYAQRTLHGYPADEVEKLEANRLARRANTGGGDYFNFGNSLTVKGGILTVADDLLKNDGKKFLDMMERLAERRLQRDDEVHLDQDIEYYDDEEDDDDEIYEDENEEDVRTEVQRMEEGRRMFQIFAARMFEQRVLAAYREKVAKERQQRLLQELEEEDRQRQDRELKKQRDKELKKDRKRQLKQQQEQERLAKEAQRLADEAKKRAEQQQKVDNDRQKRELERQKKNDERRIKEEEKRLKEEDKRRRLKEEKERIAEKERQRKEKEEVDHREKEFLKEKERREKELKDE